MKKHIFLPAICALLAASLLAGCGKAENTPEAPEASEPAVSAETPAAQETPAVQETPEYTNAEAEQAYMDFLNGQTRASFSEKFREDDGKYSLEELRSAAEHEGQGSTVKYALLDFGGDGVNELVLRFDSTEPSLMNWVGIIRYNGEGLDLNYCYEDGYRTFSTLYTSGYLLIGGSIGAGASVSSIVGFDKNGVGSNVFTEAEYHGTFATGIAYDLQGTGLEDPYDDIAGESQFIVREYTADGAIKISADGWSAESAVRAREEELMDELASLGAELISQEEMESLCSLSPYEAAEVEWLVWGEEAAVPEVAADAAVSADYASDELLARPEAYYEFIADDSEYQEKVVILADAAVKDLRVLSLNMTDVNDKGELTFSGEELYYLDELTPEKPLVVGMAFAGEIPNMGLSYVDAGGEARVYAISMSGNDGSLLLTEVSLER